MNALLAPKRRRFTVDDVLKMAQVGIIEPDERLELIEGELVEMVPTGTLHSYVSNQLRDLLAAAAGRSAIVRTGQTLYLSPQSAPDPDVLALAPRPGKYRNDRATAADVLLLCEVSDTTLQKDQGPKRDLYAQYGIREYWIVDVDGEQVFVYTDPANGAYGPPRTLRRGEALSPGALPSVRIAVADLFA